jgi:hypothetical protein
MSSRSGPETGRLASTWSRLTGSRYWALGFSAPLRWLLTETAAKSRSVAPLRSM